MTQIEGQNETLIGFILTAYDSYGHSTGEFLEDDRYLTTDHCYKSEEGQRIVLEHYPHASIYHAGPLYQNEVKFQWRAPAQSESAEVPMQVRFHLTLALPGDKIWTAEPVAKFYLI